MRQMMMPAPPFGLIQDRAVKSIRQSLILGLIVFVVNAAAGQVPMPRPMPPPAPPAASPLLFIRIAGPTGMRLVFPSGRLARRLAPPAVFGLRPGYVFQFEITDLPERRDIADAPRSLYPTIEVRGTLTMPPGISAANHPAPIVFSNEDILRAQSGALVTKVVVLECPDRAAHDATTLDRPLEFEVRPGLELFEEARTRGRPIAIVRLGGREAAEEELLSSNVPGTVLFPGDKVVGPAASPPILPYACWPVYDPILGPRGSSECICDGGDRGYRVGYGANGQIYGLDPSDTVAEYADSQGKKHIACSNPVCVFAPRFVIVKSEMVAVGYTANIGVAGALATIGQFGLQSRTSTVVAAKDIQVEAMRAKESVSINQATTGTVVVDQLAGLAEATAKTRGVTVTGECVKPPRMPPDRPLCLIKSADRATAQVGDIITFKLVYTNKGGKPMTNVAVSDSLTTRLQYVADSQRTDREAIFTTAANEAGSVVLRWQIGGSLVPGASGTITFEARVR